MGYFCYNFILFIYLFSGSGSSYLYGFFDQAWKEGMTKDEAEVCIRICMNLLVTNAIIGFCLVFQDFNLT